MQQSTTALIAFTACSAYYLILAPLQYAFNLSWRDAGAPLNALVDIIAVLAFLERVRGNFKEEDDWISRVKAVNSASSSEKQSENVPVHKKLRFWIDLAVVFPLDVIVPIVSLMLPSIVGAAVTSAGSVCSCDIQPESLLIPLSSGCYTQLRLVKLVTLVRLPAYFSALEQPCLM